jgi:hypothetical protein
MSLESDGGMLYWQGKAEELGEKPVPLPLCPPQIPHGLTRVRNRASVVRLATNDLSHGTAHGLCYINKSTRSSSEVWSFRIVKFSHTNTIVYSVSFNCALVLSFRFIVLSCGVYVDEIHDGMLALLSQVRYFGQDFHNPLNPSCNYIHHLFSQSVTLHLVHREYLWVLYYSQNKWWLFPKTALSNWLLYYHGDKLCFVWGKNWILKYSVISTSFGLQRVNSIHSFSLSLQLVASGLSDCKKRFWFIVASDMHMLNKTYEHFNNIQWINNVLKQDSQNITRSLLIVSNVPTLTITNTLQTTRVLTCRLQKK